MSNIWKCEFCGQCIEIADNGAKRLPEGYFDKCKLREDMVGDECIAFRQPDMARTIVMDAGNQEALKQRRTVRRGGGETFEPLT